VGASAGEHGGRQRGEKVVLGSGFLILLDAREHTGLSYTRFDGLIIQMSADRALVRSWSHNVKEIGE
jgi:hypothetical protein